VLIKKFTFLRWSFFFLQSVQ